jgi:hypothetical protein
MLKQIACVALLLTSSLSFSQEVNNKNNLNQSPTINEKQSKEKYPGVNFTTDQILKMNELLFKNDYQNFYNFILSSKVSRENYISYLLSKQYDGIVPIYWLIADFYAQEKKFYDAHKWFYISLIMTQQDAYLCSDESAKNASRKLMEFFPESVFVTRATPQYIEDSMREVNFFITNLKTRIEPNWVCYYANKAPSNVKNMLIERNFWGRERERVLKNFVDKYQK